VKHLLFLIFAVQACLPGFAACDGRVRIVPRPAEVEELPGSFRLTSRTPVVITDYATSGSQLEDGVDGVIDPMDNAGCAAGIAALLRDPTRMQQLSENCAKRDYTNSAEVEKIYALMED